MKRFLWSLFTNRRGAACVACFCLVFGVVTMFGVWGFLCLSKGVMFDLPAHLERAIYALAGLKAWTTGWDHLSAAQQAPVPPPAPEPPPDPPCAG